MQGRCYRFAEFELDVAESELRTSGLSVRLQEKPLLLLCALLDHPQTTVTRQQLRDRMWASDTFVDYEQGINVAIRKIRDALGESAENPRFIQTVSKKGYRFLLPVEVIGPSPVSPAAAIPQPVVNIPETPHAASVSRPSGRHYWAVVTVAAAVLISLAVWLFRAQVVRARRPMQIHSLAVLPLQNLSPDPGQDYFADGVTEDVITNLAQSLPLRVISRTSVMRYKQTTEPLAQIAQELGVEAIVEGSAARVGHRITVTVQLIDAGNCQPGERRADPAGAGCSGRISSR
jgi:TolB-like protein/DNA-binding winged helix-turn-helix (wHTH) protein